MALPLDVRRPGAATAEPFTVLVIANPALEAPIESGRFAADPILADAGGFAAAADYIEAAIFGALPGQAERLLGDPAIEPHVRMLAVFDPGLGVSAANALVGQDSSGNVLIPRRAAIRDLLAAHGLLADVVFAVSASTSHTRASAWYTSDDDAGPGEPFTVDGVTMHHRHRCRIPGTVAIHRSATGLTAAHELCHALSSYTNGKVVDLCYDGPPALNVRVGRPIPTTFATYDGDVLASDPTRHPLGYPGNWQIYHCERSAPGLPALMDAYSSNACENDVITRRFLRDRVIAKIGR